MSDNSLLHKLDDLVARFEEVEMLITDPAVIADQHRFVKLTREYNELQELMQCRDVYIISINLIIVEFVLLDE